MNSNIGGRLTASRGSPAELGPRSIRLHLADGTPQGLAIAEIVNWTGLVLSAPRSRIAELLRRPEAARTGVYILAGPDPEQPRGISVYIGETDNIAKRLPIHLRSEDRDFFERVAVVVAKDDLLIKNHARFIESQLISIAADAGDVSLENTTLPNFTLLPDADKADMAYFVRQLRLVLPLLGFGLFRHPVPPPVAEEQTLFTMSAAGATATARETDEGFLVLAGSTARIGGTETFPAGYRALRDQLVQERRLVRISGAGVYRFAQEVAFASPSAAAAVIAGRSASGPVEWEVKSSGQAYREWRAERLDGAGVNVRCRLARR